jgi:tetratricopeptide (TPR) repeat protein
MVCAVLIVLCLLAIYFGSYLPYNKARRYIAAVGLLGGARRITLPEFQSELGAVFAYYSPVGQQEVARFSGNTVLDLMNRARFPEEVSRSLVDFLTPLMTGNDVRELLAVAYLYEYEWRTYHREGDFRKAEAYYQRIHAIAPRMPHGLYSLLGMYEAQGDEGKAREMTLAILGLWPKDERMRFLLENR